MYEGIPVVIRLATVLVKFDALPINVTYSNLQPNICVHEKHQEYFASLLCK